MTKDQQSRSLYRTIRRRARLFVVPHADNQYRPHLIRRYGIGIILLFVLASQFVDGQFSASAKLGDTSLITPTELLVQTNTQRELAQVPLVQLNERLSRAAYYKGKDMFANQYWAHTSPVGVQPWKWLADVNYDYGYAGENLAKNFSSSRAVVDAWMGSAEHKENMLKSEYKDVGFAIVNGILDGQPTSIVVALYASPVPNTVQGAQFSSAHDDSLGLAGQLGRNVHGMPPVVLASIILLILAAFVATTAHLYRGRLPRSFRKTWYRHHGAYKAFGLLSLMLVVLAVYNTGGQI